MRMSMLVTNTVSAVVLLAVALHTTSTQAAPIEFTTEVLADGPIGYWRLGEAPGSASAADSSGHGNNGTYSSGGITLGQPGFHGGDTAALFDGTTGRIVVPNSDALNPSNITMETKIRWDGRNGLQQRILEKSSYAELAQYGLSILDDGHVQVEIRTNAAQVSPGTVDGDLVCPGWNTPGSTVSVVCAKSMSVVALNVETHIAATYDGRIIRIYLNGIPDGQANAGGDAGDISPKPPTPANLIESGLGIGNQTARDRPFKGLIDEVALYATALSAKQIQAHYQSQFAERVMFQYAVKFVCGKSEGRVVAPGAYFTAINVHNPNERGIGFKKKFAVALPGEHPGPISKFFDAKLGPDQAFEIDCPDILRRTGTKGGFLKGFVVIESALELDVVAVYTAAGASGRVDAMELERVKPRRQETAGNPGMNCVDFEPPLVAGTQYGQPVGQLPGTVIFTTNGIPVSVHDFLFLNAGGTFNLARIEPPPVPFGSGQTIRTNNINLEFDFSPIGFPTSQVQFEFLDLGGLENISVNGSPIFAGELAAAPNPIGGVGISVTTVPVTGGKRGTVTLTGVVKTLRIGGQEFWIDQVCAR